MLLQHLESLAKTAYSGISSNPEENSGKVVEEYSKELAADVQLIKAAAASFNQDATAAVNRYQAEYEMHLTVWLNALGKCGNAVNASTSENPSENPSPDLQRRSRRADNKFKRFREWHDKAIKGVQRKFLPRNTPVTELESAKANLEAREQRQRQMKKANVIIRSKKDVTARLVELLGPGSEEEAARLQQLDQEGNATGFTAHDLNNNNANIFRLKRRVKDLERKISLMDHSNEEKKEINGIKMIYNYGADRIQLFFSEKPQAGRLRQLKGNGWHWSPSAGCWQRKVTESAKKSAESICNGEFSEEMNAAAVAAAGEKKEKKEKKVKSAKKKSEPKKIVDKINESTVVTSVTSPVVPIAAPKKIAAAVINTPKEEKKQELKPAPAKVNSAELKKQMKKEMKAASKREMKREILIKPPTRTEIKIEVKPKTEEKPKPIDWSKIAAQVEQRSEQKVVMKEEPAAYSNPKAAEEPAAQNYSYERYAD